MTVSGLVSRSSGEKAQRAVFFSFSSFGTWAPFAHVWGSLGAAGAAPTSTEASTTSDPGEADLPLPAGGAESGGRARGPGARILRPQTRTNIRRVSTAAHTTMRAARSHACHVLICLFSNDVMFRFPTTTHDLRLCLFYVFGNQGL